MQSDDEVFEGVGPASSVDHVAVQTAFGMLIAATTLFKKLGFTVHPTRMAGGSWGKAIFMIKDGSLPIQLTDSSDPAPVSAGENHFGITVQAPLAVALAIKAWAQFGRVSAEWEAVPGGKYFVTIPAILTMPIELVPSQQ